MWLYNILDDDSSSRFCVRCVLLRQSQKEVWYEMKRNKLHRGRSLDRNFTLILSVFTCNVSSSLMSINWTTTPPPLPARHHFECHIFLLLCWVYIEHVCLDYIKYDFKTRNEYVIVITIRVQFIRRVLELTYETWYGDGGWCGVATD